MDSATELLQVEGQVLDVLADPGDGAGDSALMGIRVTPRGVGRRAVTAVPGTDLTRITLFEVVNVESFSVPCWREKQKRSRMDRSMMDG
jgi:hypothetical protein